MVVRLTKSNSSESSDMYCMRLGQDPRRSMHVLERVTSLYWKIVTKQISIQENILGMAADDGWLYV